MKEQKKKGQASILSVIREVEERYKINPPDQEKEEFLADRLAELIKLPSRNLKIDEKKLKAICRRWVADMFGPGSKEDLKNYGILLAREIQDHTAEIFSEQED
jgi:hypothetical protein